jgi:GMP synthase-like glutamine amidotransferase
MLLILDNSVTKNDKYSYIKELIRTLKKYKIPYMKVNKIQDIDLKKITSIVISGSSFNLSKNAKNIHPFDYSFNLYYLSKLSVPVFGLCFGCQLLNIIYGGTLIRNKSEFCGYYESKKFENIQHFYDNMDTSKMYYCFSDIVVPPKNRNVKIFASFKKDNKVIDSGFVFEKNKVFGSMFHPEISDESNIFYLHFYEYCKNFE